MLPLRHTRHCSLLLQPRLGRRDVIVPRRADEHDIIAEHVGSAEMQ